MFPWYSVADYSYLSQDMDLYDESRTLVYSGPVSRRARSETGFSSGGWTELVAALLDNFCEALSPSWNSAQVTL